MANGKGTKLFYPNVKQTNADRIRSMTDEELENFLGLVSWEDEPWCENRRDCDENMKCRECLREWLKQEAAEDDN